MGKFTPTEINPQLCTHLVYAFTVLDGEKLTIKTSDDWLDVEKGNYIAFNELKKENTKLKTLISLGGWVDSNDNRESYNLVFNNEKARETFINSVLAFLENWGFDGLDVSFEFPQINERKGFATWIKKIKEAFGKKYELTISVPANKEKIQAGKC